MSGAVPLITAMSSIKSSPKWSMRGRGDGGGLGSGRESKTPGPGTYGLIQSEKTRYARAPQAMFGSSLRDEVGPGGKAPGPGQYTQNNNAFNRTSPQWGFGTSTRGGIASGGGRATTPGPGTYDIRKDLGGVQISMTARRNGDGDGKRSMTPGPGGYNANLTHFEASPRFGFGTALRPELSRASKFPGPGTYTQGNSMGQESITLGTAPKYSMKPRRNPALQGSAASPGPSFTFTQFG